MPLSVAEGLLTLSSIGSLAFCTYLWRSNRILHRRVKDMIASGGEIHASVSGFERTAELVTGSLEQSKSELNRLRTERRMVEALLQGCAKVQEQSEVTASEMAVKIHNAKEVAEELEAYTKEARQAAHELSRLRREGSSDRGEMNTTGAQGVIKASLEEAPAAPRRTTSYQGRLPLPPALRTPRPEAVSAEPASFFARIG